MTKKTRPTTNFDSSELEAFKAELSQATIKPAATAAFDDTRANIAISIWGN
ncbi:MAG: hypothetical protein PUP91_30450 [Rhizonema sp. PD37]|nr:hypothetical protein [Rhizonema sp. PD37]